MSRIRALPVGSDTSTTNGRGRSTPRWITRAQPRQPGADPPSLGDAEATTGILDGASFDGVRFEDVHEPVLYGHDVDAALAIVRGFQNTRVALASMSDSEAARTVERLREVLAANYSDERGVALDSRSWLITARRRR